MFSYTPVLGSSRPRLGQFGGLTDTLARSIIEQAEPATRRVIRDERNRLAEALIGGIPFAAIAAIGGTATLYLVPAGSKSAKFIGYSMSALTLGIGAWWSFSRLTDTPDEPEEAASGTVADAAQTAAKAIVAHAEPKIRLIVEEERSRIAEAIQAGVPFWGASAIGVAATAFLVHDTAPVMKVAGYGASALIAALGAWLALEKERA
jgi:hypothetical protein